MNVYSIAVALSMTSNAPQVLSALSHQLLHVNSHVNALQSNLNRVKLAVGGAFAVAGGVALLRSFKDITDSAKELNHEIVQIKKMNIGGGDAELNASRLAQVRDSARGLTRDVKGVTETDAIKTYGSSYSIFGHDGAIKLMKPLQEFAQVMGNQTHDYEAASKSVYAMIRAGELTGQFTDAMTHKVDPGKVQQFLELGSKVMLGTHGMVKPETMLALAQQGGPAMSGLSQQGFFSMAIAAQAMGGHRAGTALTSLYQQMIGGKMTGPVAEEMDKLGLIKMVQKGKKRMWAGTDPKLTEALQRDPLEMTKVIVDAMKAKGITDQHEQVNTLFKILGRQTTQRLVHDLLRNFDQITAERDRISGAVSQADAKGKQDGEDPVQAERNVGAAWQNFKTAIGGPNGEAMVAILNRTADAIRAITEGARGMNPDTLRNIGVGIAAMGAALVAGGAAALLVAIGPAGWLVAGFTALGIALQTIKPGYFQELAKAWMGLFDSIKNLDFSGAAKALAEIINKGLLGIPGMIGGAVAAMAAKIGSLISGALAGVTGGATLPGAKSGVTLNPGDELPGVGKQSSLKSAVPASNKQATVVHTKVNLDGRQIASNTVRHMGRASTNVASASGFDGRRALASPDMQAG